MVCAEVSEARCMGMCMRNSVCVVYVHVHATRPMQDLARGEHALEHVCMASACTRMFDVRAKDGGWKHAHQRHL